MLLVHGEDNKRAPFAQAKATRVALDTAHRPYEWLSKPGEAHGFSNKKNVAEFYRTLEEFLDKYIEPHASGTAPTAPQLESHT